MDIVAPPTSGVRFTVTPAAERQLLLNRITLSPGILLGHLRDAYTQVSRAASAALGEVWDSADFDLDCALRDAASCPSRKRLADHVCDRVRTLLPGLDYPRQVPVRSDAPSVVDELQERIDFSLQEQVEIDLFPFLVAHGEPRHVSGCSRHADERRRTDDLVSRLRSVAADAAAVGAFDCSEVATQVADDLSGCRQHLIFSRRTFRRPTVFRPLHSCRRWYCPACEGARNRRTYVCVRNFLSELDRDRSSRGGDFAAVLSLGRPVFAAGVAERVEQITREFRRLKRCSAWHRGVLGYVGVLHVVRTVDRRWHVHLHLVMRLRWVDDTDCVPNPAAVLSLWGVDRETGEVCGVARVQPTDSLLRSVAYAVADAKRGDEGEGIGDEIGGVFDVGDVWSFVDDVSDADAAFALLVQSELRGVNRVLSGGVLRGCLTPPVRSDLVEDVSWLPETQFPDNTQYRDGRLYCTVFEWQRRGGYQSIPRPPVPRSALVRAREWLRDVQVADVGCAARAHVDEIVLYIGKIWSCPIAQRLGHYSLQPQSQRARIAAQRIDNADLCKYLQRSLPLDPRDRTRTVEHLRMLSDDDLALFGVATAGLRRQAVRLVQLRLLQDARWIQRRASAIANVRTKICAGIVGWYQSRIEQIAAAGASPVLSPPVVIDDVPHRPTLYAAVRGGYGTITVPLPSLPVGGAVSPMRIAQFAEPTTGTSDITHMVTPCGFFLWPLKGLKGHFSGPFLLMRNPYRSLAPLGLTVALLVSGCQAAANRPLKGEDVAAPPIDAPAQSLSTHAMAESFYEVLVAEMLGQQGDFASSYELLMRAATTREQDDLFQRAGQAALHMGDGERALRAAKVWQDTLPQSREANKVALQLLIAMNRIPQTQWHLKQELRLTPDEEMAENLYAIPLIYQRTPNKEIAFTVVQAALHAQLQPDSPWRGDALAVLGRLRLHAGDVEAAFDYLQQAHAANAQSGGMGLFALELFNAGEARAEPLLRAYADEPAAAAPFLLAYARWQIGRGQEAQALQTLVRLTDKKPDLPEAWLAKAALQAGQRDYAGARTSLDVLGGLLDNLSNAQARQRGLDEAAVLRAQMADLEGEYAQADRWIAQIEDAETAMRAQVQRARILAEAGRLAHARHILQSVPAENAQQQRLKVLAEVQLLRDAQQFEQAYVLLGNLLKSHPKDGDLAYEHALLAERAGHIKEMEKSLRALLARQPDHVHALNALGYSLADRGVRLSEARTLIAKALELEPESAHIIDSMGWLEYRLGRLPQALELLQKAYRIEADPEIAAHLGEVLWKLEQHDEARRVWSQGLARDAKNTVLRATIERLDGAASALLRTAPHNKVAP